MSLVVALLMTAASLAGLLAPHTLYPTEALRHGFVSNDVVNLVLGLPLLLVAPVLTRRGQLLGLLFWPGALFYVTYNYIAYAVTRPLTWQFVLYLALVGLSTWAILRLLKSIDGAAVQAQLAGAVPARFGGGVLAALGALFFVRAVAPFTHNHQVNPRIVVTRPTCHRATGRRQATGPVQAV
ncbi:MAG TPA: hypothetical protein ENN19_17780 [Chloroflexi bacterium]|nr:hypothetical protein [Chloroflexota bacterium]